MDNLGQFNLIVGDNNVGKTSVLEALLVDVEINPIKSLYNLFIPIPTTK
jgi:AAA15 family ATPase/GTPase